MIPPHIPQRGDIVAKRAIRFHRLAACAAILGPTSFVCTFVVEGWRRTGYDSTSMFVSALAMGPDGWIQIVNFIVVGVLLIVFSHGLAREYKEAQASRAGPTILAAIGFSLIASGPFVMDLATTPFLQMSWHSKVHYFFGAVVFSLAPLSCFLFFRRFRAEVQWRSFQWPTLTAGIVISAAVIVMKVAMIPNAVLYNWVGAIQRVALVTYMLWVACFGVASLKRQG